MGLLGKMEVVSTLLRSIADVFSPNEGTIDLHNHSVSLMAIGVGFKPLLTGRGNIMLVDEVLSVGDEKFRKKFLKNERIDSRRQENGYNCLT